MIHEDINTLARFCGVRDVKELTQAEIKRVSGGLQADLMVLFGGSILCGGDVLAEAMKDKIARKYMIVGGAGHTTQTLRDTVRRLYPEIETQGLPEAEVFNRYLWHRYGLSADYLETSSTNCGNNITLMLQMIKEQELPVRSIILCQDVSMQRRMAAGLEKYAPEMNIINYAAYRVTVKPDMTFQAIPPGMWEMERYISLLMGEVPRLADGGYGPGGKGYIAHVDIPPCVTEAFERLKARFPDLVRAADPAYSTK